MEQTKKIFGERDQELLFRAFAHFVANTTRKSINIVIGMLQMCIAEAIESSAIDMSQTKKLDENKRKELLETGIDEFIKRSKVGAVHRREIKKGCMTIYERWREIRNAIRDERDIHMEELLADQSSQIIGYDDQEVLLAAFAHYVSGVTGMEKNSVIKLIRVCMLEVTIPKRVNFKETRFLDQETRGSLIKAGIEEFLKRARIDGKNADIIRADCLKVYERWKEIRRVNPEAEEIQVTELVK